MKLKRSEILAFFVVLVSFGVAFYFYSKVPTVMPAHWNIRGEVDGYLPKFWGIFLMPLISLAMFLMFLLIPRIDPLKENIEKFRKYFDGFILLILLFFFYLYTLTLLWTFGVRFNMTQVLSPAFGLLFLYSGILIENAKRNWFIGIRTPWTLSNEQVWDKTHKFGGKLFKVSGIICFLGVFVPDISFYLVFIPVFLSAIYIIFYSYFEYQKEIKR